MFKELADQEYHQLIVALKEVKLSQLASLLGVGRREDLEHSRMGDGEVELPEEVRKFFETHGPATVRKVLEDRFGVKPLRAIVVEILLFVICWSSTRVSMLRRVNDNTVGKRDYGFSDEEAFFIHLNDLNELLEILNFLRESANFHCKRPHAFDVPPRKADEPHDCIYHVFRVLNMSN